MSIDEYNKICTDWCYQTKRQVSMVGIYKQLHSIGYIYTFDIFCRVVILIGEYLHKDWSVSSNSGIRCFEWFRNVLVHWNADELLFAFDQCRFTISNIDVYSNPDIACTHAVRLLKNTDWNFMRSELEKYLI